MYAFLGTASAIGLSAGLYHFGPNIFLNWLADGNIYVTRVKEGTAKAIMRGGGLHRFVMKHEGHHLNDPSEDWYDPGFPKWEVMEDELGMKYESRAQRYQKLGLYHVGFPPPFSAYSVFEYEFHWVETKLDKSTGMLANWPRSSMTERIYTSNFPYVVIVDAAETDDLIPVNVVLQLTVRITNPYKALFGVENWMEAVTGKVLDASRKHVGGKTYSDLKTEVHPTPAKPVLGASFSDSISAVEEDIKSINGVEIESVSVMKVDLAGPHAVQLQADAARAFSAQQVADAEVIEAKAAATVTTIAGAAKAEVIEVTGKADGAASKARLDGLATHPELAAHMMTTDAIAKSGANVTLIDPFGSASGIAQKVARAFSGNKGE